MELLILFDFTAKTMIFLLADDFVVERFRICDEVFCLFRFLCFSIAGHSECSKYKEGNLMEPIEHL